LIKVQLELGGKDPTYVADDVDPASAAASLADGAMYNTGQSCMCLFLFLFLLISNGIFIFFFRSIGLIDCEF
jgi:hypothetical protein